MSGSQDFPRPIAPSNVEPPSGRFVQSRPRRPLRPRPWHRYAHHLRSLPAGIERLAREIPLPADARILDYGAAEGPYRRLFPGSAQFETADLAGNPGATIELGADGTVPVGDQSFDLVLSTQVLEHVEDPNRHLSECFRVLRPGGHALISTHGTFIFHPDPVDYWRWTSAGLQRIVRQEGFEIVRFEGVIGLAATGLQLFQDALHHHLPLRLGQLFALCVQSLMAVADRLQSAESARINASVFVLVARRPSQQ